MTESRGGSITMLAVVTAAAASIYLLLTIAAIISLFSSDLTLLSLHGKTRDGPDDRDDECNDDSPKRRLRVIIQPRRRLRRLYYYFIHDRRFTIHKRRFVDFYITGIIITLIVMLHFNWNYSINDTMTTTDARSSYSSDHHHGRMPRMIRPIYLLFAHLVRRYYECKWVHKSNSPMSLMHMAGYLLGLLHYICLPFIFLPSYYNYHAYDSNDCSICAITRDAVVDSNREVLFNISSCSKDDDVQQQYAILHKVMEILPIAGCFYFQYIQHIHHVILANLRKSKGGTGSGRQCSTTIYYSIPLGGWFHYISCPHYLSEIMIYFMLALLIHNNNLQKYNTLIDDKGNNEFYNLSLSILTIMHNFKHWILFLWVVINLSISANRTHDWYRMNFGLNYPQERKRLIPFIW